MTDTEAFVALNMIPRLGPVRLRTLLSALGSPQAVLSASADTLRDIDGIPKDAARSIASWQSSVHLEEELRLAEKSHASILTQNDPRYPSRLKEIYDPPIVLYLLGELLPRDDHAIAVVGTRKPTTYAQDCTKKLSYQLAYSGLTITSGLAHGVDTLAHQSALAAKGRTLAVIGSGLANIYPARNLPLAEKIADGNGAVLSEFPMATPPDRQTFPIRNRVVTGLSFGTLVIEAGTRSGSLISAAQTAEQGRSLYAIPGRIDNPNAFGSNRLLQNGAKLVTSSEDILEDLGLLFPVKPELPPPPSPADLSETESLVFLALGSDELLFDQIIVKTGLPSHKVSSTLLALEMRGLVKNLPGSRFVKLT